jgi:ABC-type uncharacterized transport system involved in gliding motility auxiliary subunit
VDISDAAQFAIDQFVLRGGKLLAFLDPHAYFDQKHERSQDFTIGGDNASKSSLDKLLKACGLNMDVNLVAADTSFAGRFQLSAEKANKVNAPTPRPGAASTSGRTACAPARWPAVRGSPRRVAQRPLPSMTMAT